MSTYVTMNLFKCAVGHTSLSAQPVEKVVCTQCSRPARTGRAAKKVFAENVGTRRVRVSAMRGQASASRLPPGVIEA